MDKVLRDLKRALEPLGYEYKGKRHGAGSGPGRGHHVFRRDDGAVMTTASTPKNPGRALAMAVANAKRIDKRQAPISEQWRSWLREQYGVGDTDVTIVEWVERDLRRRFLDSHPEAKAVTSSLFSVALRESDLFQTVERGNSHKPGKLMIRGPLAGLTIDTEEADDLPAPVERVPEPVPAPAPVDGGSGEPRDAGSVGEGDQPEREAAPRERPAPPREPVVAAPRGVTLAEGLAAQLVDALAGDLRAENDLLREAVSTASAQLIAIGTELAAALDLGSAQTAESKYGANHGIGPKALEYLRALEAGRDQLPTLFTATDATKIVAAAGVTVSRRSKSGNLRDAVDSAMARYVDAGILRRKGRGVYEWAE